MSMGVLDVRPLRILSVDDRPRSVLGSIGSLRRDGHVIRSASTVSDACMALQALTFDFLMVDERLEGPNGTHLVHVVKEGKVGSRNADLPFVFVTGNANMLDETELEGIQGYLGTYRKGGPLTPQLREVARDVARREPSLLRPPLRRVIARVESWSPDDPSALQLLVPSWKVDQSITVPIGALPGSRNTRIGDLLGAHFFAWINLDAETSADVVLTGFDAAPDLEDVDDGLS